jgi:hypothetical protein
VRATVATARAAKSRAYPAPTAMTSLKQAGAAIPVLDPLLPAAAKLVIPIDWATASVAAKEGMPASQKPGA